MDFKTEILKRNKISMLKMLKKINKIKLIINLDFKALNSIFPNI